MWMTKLGQLRKVHFVVDGVPLCASQLAPFKSAFGEFDPWYHLCTICRREEAKLRTGARRRCTCRVCGIVPEQAHR